MVVSILVQLLTTVLRLDSKMTPKRLIIWEKALSVWILSNSCLSIVIRHTERKIVTS